MSRVKVVGIYAGSFVLVACMMLIAAAMSDLYPLGERLFMLNDMNAQYVDFFAWFKDVLSGNASPFYIKTQGLGGNAAGLFAYYVVSPFNLLIAFFSERDIAVLFFVITILKVGCIQMTMMFYLRRRFGLPYAWACALALGFSLSMWVLTQVRNIMWIDGLIFMPLTAWGICCLLRSGKWKLFTFSLAAAIITNWYMGYILVLFFCLYVLFEAYALGFEGVQSYGKVHRKRLMQFAGCLFVALALSAFVFLPAVLSMAGDGTMVDMNTRLQMAQDMVVKHLPALASVPALWLIAAGLGALLLVVVCLLVIFRKKTLRARLAIVLFACLLMCLASCIAIKPLHQGTYADLLGGLFLGTWVNDMTPQLFTTFPILILAIVFFVSKRVPTKLKLALGLFLFLLILSTWSRLLMFIWGGMRIPHGYQSRIAFLGAFMIIWAAAWIAAAFVRRPPERLARVMKWSGAAMLVLGVVGLTIRSTLVWNVLYVEGYQRWFDEYMDEAYAQAEELEAYDPGVYRVEKTYLRNNSPALNEGLTLGFNQISSYTSTTDQAVIDFLSALGCGDNEFFTLDLHPSLVSDSLFGVKYLSMAAPPLEGYTDVGLTELSFGVKFYENPYALSLGYGVSPDIEAFGIDAKANRWTNMEAFASAIAGSPITLFADIDTEKGAAVLDMETFKAFIGNVAQHQATFQTFEPGFIQADFDAAEGQLLLLTIPAQDGWTIEVNGNQVDAISVAGGALMALPVQAGANHIEMHFMPPGIHAGMAITLITLVLIGGEAVVRRYRR